MKLCVMKWVWPGLLMNGRRTASSTPTRWRFSTDTFWAARQRCSMGLQRSTLKCFSSRAGRECREVMANPFTAGLPYPTVQLTIHTIDVLAFAVPPCPRGTLTACQHGMASVSDQSPTAGRITVREVAPRPLDFDDSGR